ncbi:3-hydroxyacyl-CoA dehydrogenase [Hydrogenophilus thermoluteolus]|uniref:3-hydroxyacyl-CoA dehydrogenase n=1 Tax=Hydrogenophilus thermoluteolus TaxID=297 RepID=UPI00249FAF1A|nr:3-hydroxyacyl-CoA dehydrogenase [Hydrogenophilus thermoluteolus]GLW60891.1 3-hydroxyacyl-CoA dehydrogenase [Hydrogenophilus thermoluteolus]
MTQATETPSQALPPSAPVLIIGAGAMGRGIAQVAATAGHPVTLYDLDAAQLDAAKAAIERDLASGVAKGKIPAKAAEATQARLTYTQDFRETAPLAALVIEAIVENLEVKKTLFRDLEALVAPHTILASNTSSLSITAIAAPLTHPERVVGMHFFNPATHMKLVEVVSGLQTDPAVAETVQATARAWGKIAVRAKSTPGFIVNRVARPFYGEALRLLLEQTSDTATIDAILRDAGNFRMGPFELMDLIGHDVNAAVTRSVWEAYGYDPRFQPSLIQEELVRAGHLGRKSGRGFYDYREGAHNPAPQEAEPHPLADPNASLIGDHPALDAMATRLHNGGVAVKRATVPSEPCIETHGVRIVLTDGRPATLRALAEQNPSLAVLDWVRDWKSATRIAVAFAATTPDAARAQAIALLQAAGLRAAVIADTAGLVFARTQAMLANEAADAVHQGVASAEEIDLAMRYGTNYPEGPLAWAERVGVIQVTQLLRHLHQFTGDPRYRVSPYLQLRAAEAALNRAPRHLG